MLWMDGLLHGFPFVSFLLSAVAGKESCFFLADALWQAVGGEDVYDIRTWTNERNDTNSFSAEDRTMLCDERGIADVLLLS